MLLLPIPAGTSLASLSRLFNVISHLLMCTFPILEWCLISPVNFGSLHTIINNHSVIITIKLG